MQKSRKALNKTLLDKCKKAAGVGVAANTRLSFAHREFYDAFPTGSRFFI